MRLARHWGKHQPARGNQEQRAFLQALVDEARVLTSGQASALCLVDESSTGMWLTAGSGSFADHVGAEAPADHGLSGRVLASPDSAVRLSCQTACCPFAPSSSHHHIVARVQAGNRVRGVLCATSDAPVSLARNWESMLTQLARMAGSCLGGERVGALAKDLGSMAERQQIAADMHDGITQRVVTLRMQLDTALGELARGGDSLPRLLTMNDTLTGILEEARTMIESLRNPRDRVQEPQGLVDVLRSAARDADLGADVISIRAGHDFLVPPTTAIEVRRIVIEALTNAKRHAHASAMSVGLEQEGGEAIVRVTDNGCGIAEHEIADSVAGGASPSSPPAKAAHFGEDIMRLRASLIGGRLEIHGGPGKGTEVILQWPQPAE